jgi:hypothetical protein
MSVYWFLKFLINPSYGQSLQGTKEYRSCSNRVPGKGNEECWYCSLHPSWWLPEDPSPGWVGGKKILLWAVPNEKCKRGKSLYTLRTYPFAAPHSGDPPSPTPPPSSLNLARDGFWRRLTLFNPGQTRPINLYLQVTTSQHRVIIEYT